MRRLFIVLFLLLTSVQLALAGLPATAVHVVTAGQDDLVAAAANKALSGHGSSHAMEADHPLTCDMSFSPCMSCDSCHTCQQVAIADDVSGRAVGTAQGNRFIWLSTRFASAESAPVFKPPIV
ncbi:MAG: hypothetical protein I8H77_15645 [Comamonadaceae bacterium]|nr:hypothetical protein [Comamonadaceae bacterium]